MSNLESKSSRTSRHVRPTMAHKVALEKRKAETGIPESKQIVEALEAYLRQEPQNAHRALLRPEDETVEKTMTVADSIWNRLHERRKKHGFFLDDQVHIALTLYFAALNGLDPFSGEPLPASEEEPATDETEAVRLVVRDELAKLREAGRDISILEIGEVTGGVPVHQFDAAPCGPVQESVFEAKHAVLPAVIAQVLKAKAGDWLVPARGESMVEAGIADGALVLMRPYLEGRKPYEGDIVLVSIETDDGQRYSTIKYWYSGSRGRVDLRDGQLRPFSLPYNLKSIYPMAVYVGIIGPAVGGTGTAKGRRAAEGGRPGTMRNRVDLREFPESE